MKKAEKVEHPHAPIRTILTMQYARIKVTIESLDGASEAEAWLLMGNAIDKCQQAWRWGNPKMSYARFIRCPNEKCKREISMQVFDALDGKCPFCKHELKGNIEL